MGSRRIWDKGDDIDASMMRYTARDDWRWDQRLLPFDLRASAAHVRGLARVGVLDDEERTQLVEALEHLGRRVEQGEMVLTPDDEDGHGAIEQALVSALGDVGKKVHTGRSRNDQVLVALRLYERDALDALDDAAVTAASAHHHPPHPPGRRPGVLLRRPPGLGGLWRGVGGVGPRPRGRDRGVVERVE
ncbi:MAG: lyase family protein, partial [Myxococcota bacterium]